MTTLKIRGVSLYEEELSDLKILAKADRRSVSFMIRDAVQEFLKSRRGELVTLKQQSAYPSTEVQS
jgi:hypothetical protein